MAFLLAPIRCMPAAALPEHPLPPPPVAPGDSPLPAASADAIDAFVDALWLEDGLVRNTLAAYRRDLTLYAQWLAQQRPALDLD